MFRGSYEHTIDSKGRISLPAQFRSLLNKDNERLVITRYNPSHLWAFPYESWIKLEEKLASFPLADSDIQNFKRVFIANAYDVPLDKLGRILIPPKLREYANLVKEVVFVGSITHIEIWSKSSWEATFMAAEANIDQVTRKLAELGF